MNPEERIISWIKGNKKGPYSLEIRPTERCNLNCLSCVKHAEFYKKESKNLNREIPKQKYLELINDAAKLGVKKILISGGGEPFMREDIPDIVKEIKQNKIEGEIITNGTLLNKKSNELLVKEGWNSLVISLDGPNKKINDYLRTKSFVIIIKNIKNINYFKKRYRSKKPKITIATVLTNKNYNLLHKMLKLCKKLNVDYFRLQNLILWSEKGKTLKLNKEQKDYFDSNLLNLIKYSNKLKMENNLDDFLNSSNEKNNDETFVCFAPFYDLSIASDGNIRFCQMSPKTSENIYNKSLQEIWFGKEMEDFRKKLLNKNFPNFCKNCCSPRIFDMKKINKALRRKND